MKKKLLMIFLTVSLCLQGCGAVEEKPQETPVEDSKETTDKNSEDAEDSQEIADKDTNDSQDATGEEISGNAEDKDEEDITPPEIKLSEYLRVTLEPHYDSCIENGKSLMYGHYFTINLQADDYPALTAAVEAYTEGRATQDYLDSLEVTAKEEIQEYGVEEFWGPYVWEGDMFLRRADSVALSMVEQCYEYTGGAHGYNYFNCVTFDSQTGEILELEDVIKDVNALPEILGKELTEKYPDLGFFSNPLSDALDDYINSENPLYQELLKFTWTLDYEGVTFYFGSYEIASYADGVQQATIYYSEYPELFEEKYFVNAHLGYALCLNDSWWTSDVDLDGNGVTDYIDVHRVYETDAYMSDSYRVTVNGNTYELDKYCYELETYLIKCDGKNYLYVQTTAENDFQSIDVFEITPVSVEYVDSFAGGLETFINPKSFPLTKRFDMLSTYGATGNFYIGEDGMPVAKSDVYTVNREVILTSTVDIPAELVDESGNLLGSTYTFPAGTDFTLVTTDGETYVDVLADDGQRCRFYTESRWPVTVNGMDAQSSFEMLYYAG